MSEQHDGNPGGGRISRRMVLQWMGAAGVAALAGGGTQARHRSPNILFIMADDHAAHALGCYGGRLIRTPAMDRLAREGVLFSNAFVTNSLCAPSRATILTGKYSHTHGVRDNFTDFDTSQWTFPRALRAAGYRTAVVGKWHLRSDPADFDYWNIPPGQGAYVNPYLIEMGQRKRLAGYVTDIITDIAIHKMREWKNGPFCLLLHHKAPHRNWQPAPRHTSLFARADLPLPETFDDDYSSRTSSAAQADMRIADMPDYAGDAPATLSGRERKVYNYQRFIKDYLRTIAAVDESIGRVLQFLDASGLAENTLVVYTSDNGFFLGDHGWYDKRFMYEQSLRVPLIVRFPGVAQPGTRCGAFVLNTDLAPTLLDAAGLRPPDDLHGRSFIPLLRGQQPVDWRTLMYYHYYEYPQSHRVRPHRGVRTGRYKLIHFYTVDEWEMYDLQRDPNELHNIYGGPRYAYTQKALMAEMERLSAELQVPPVQ
ncbi:MAG: sulfatase [Armatimonadota bacterium]|nr:MAG: sulfatase [Armatimonadota bacterium]